MRLIFAGTPPFAAQALTALIAAGHDIALVLTQPDRPAGRGMKLMPSAVKQVALQQGLPVAQPTTLKTPDIQAELRAVQAEVMVVAAYGLILPPVVLAIPAQGCLNIHASLLPRWRGAAPIQRAIEAGDPETGVTIMQMDAGLDTGAMLARHAVVIGADETAAELHDRLATLGAAAIVAALAKLTRLPRVAQDNALATYATKLDKAEARLDWTKPAALLARQVRAFNPVPGAWTWLDGQAFKVWRARASTDSGQPGRRLASPPQALCIACGDGALCLDEVQPAGGKRMSAEAFLAGRHVAADAPFGLAPDA